MESYAACRQALREGRRMRLLARRRKKEKRKDASRCRRVTECLLLRGGQMWQQLGLVASFVFDQNKMQNYRKLWWRCPNKWPFVSISPHTFHFQDLLAFIDKLNCVNASREEGAESEQRVQSSGLMVWVGRNSRNYRTSVNYAYLTVAFFMFFFWSPTTGIWALIDSVEPKTVWDLEQKAFQKIRTDQIQFSACCYFWWCYETFFIFVFTCILINWPHFTPFSPNPNPKTISP